MGKGLIVKIRHQNGSAIFSLEKENVTKKEKSARKPVVSVQLKQVIF